MLPPDVLNWLSQQAETTYTIDDLVEQGCMGCSLQDLMPWLSDREVFEHIAAITWQKSAREPDGEVALMTADTEGLDALLEWMLENRGECPKVYAPDDDPEVPAAIPLLRPIATNLPEDLTSEEVVDADMLEGLAEIFAAIKEAFGNQAHLMTFDYATFADNLREHDAVMLKGEFIDLTDGEIFWFTIDGRKRKLAYQSTGRSDAAFRKQAVALLEAEEASGSSTALVSSLELMETRMPEATNASKEADGTSPDVIGDDDLDWQTWLETLPETDRSVEELLGEGFQGFWLQELTPWLEDDAIFISLSVGMDGWVRTRPDSQGMVALMSTDDTCLNLVLELMEESEEDLEAAQLIAPDLEAMDPESLPLDRPTAYNLPEGMGSRDVMDDDFVAILQEVFADLKQAYGERAHLYRVDYGKFVEVAETQDTVFLTGEFVDLEDGEIYRFTMDGVQQRMRYESTGRYHRSAQTASSVQTASSAKAASAR